MKSLWQHCHLLRFPSWKHALLQRTLSLTGPPHLRTSGSHYSTNHHYAALSKALMVDDEVLDAIRTKRPVVALESTIYTHGALAQDLGLEDIVRQGGGVPAVTGVLDGVPKVGLSPEELERLIRGPARKVSGRDLAYLVGLRDTSRKLHGGTTIAGTMILARLAGIRVFGTGGLGGVHRGWQETFDISADLTELGRTRVAVVSSGCKGFLDIPATLEYLETQGVFVSTFADGRDGEVEFPAFWVRNSGVKSPYTLENDRQAAAIIQAQEQLGIESGILLANPIPQEHSMLKQEVESAIETAVAEATRLGFSGAVNTPYILTRIRELTSGQSTAANIALVRSNVERATKIALELSNMEERKTHHNPVIARAKDHSSERFTPCTAQSTLPSTARPESEKVDVLVAGSVAVDLNCDYTGEMVAGTTVTRCPRLHTSNPAAITYSVGGVGYNVALAAHRISQETTVRLCSLVGDDVAGQTVISALDANGMDTCDVRQLSPTNHSSARTARYVAVNDADKNMFVAMADMAIFSKHSLQAYWEPAVTRAKPSWLVVDGNWSEGDIKAWLRSGRRTGAKIAFEPVSTAKSTRLFPKTGGKDASLELWPNTSIDLASPNEMELKAMHDAARENGYFENPGWLEMLNSFGVAGRNECIRHVLGDYLADSGTPQMACQLLPYIPAVVTKLGHEGVLLTMALRNDDVRLQDTEEAGYIVARCKSRCPSVGGVYMRLFPIVERVPDVVSVNGVGDTFLGVLIAGLASGGKVENLINVAQKAAVYTLRSRKSVGEDLGMLERELRAASLLQERARL